MDIKLKRMSDETFDDYVWRICSNKDIGKYDIIWEQVAEILNSESGKNYTSSKWRKNYQMMKKGYERAISKEVEHSDALDELELKKIEIQKEKRKLFDTRIAFNELVRNQSRKENILEEVRAYIDNIEVLNPPKFKELKASETKAIFGIADAHFGKEFIIKDLHGNEMNIYNEHVFYNRMEMLLNEYIDIVKSEKIGKVAFFDLSDSIEGILRASGLKILRYGIVASTVKYAKYMAEWLNTLSEFVEIEYYDCLGNHDEIRPIGSKSGEFGEENMQIVINEMLKLSLLENERVTINDTRGIQYTDFPVRILAVHGQDEKNLVQSVKEYKDMYDVKIDLMISGHLHNSKQETASLHTKVIQFPTICGIDPYSVKIKKTSKAEGKAILFKGNRMYNIDIDLQ